MPTVHQHDDKLEILKLIGNRTNAKIITIIRRYPTSPRDLSIELKKDEADIVRRLKKMEKHGLVESKWGKRLDENVKLYCLTPNRMNIRFNLDGIDVEFLSKTKIDNDYYNINDKIVEPEIERALVRVKDSSSSSSSNRIITLYHDESESILTGIDHAVIVGREKEIGILQNGKSYFFVVGVPGIGKTSMVKRYIADSLKKGIITKNGVFWHIFKEVDTLDYLLGKISVFLKNNRQYDLMDYLEKRMQNAAFADNKYYAEAIDIMAKSLDKIGNNVIFVFDDFHKVKDRNIISFTQYLQREDPLLNNIQRKVVVLSRLKPPFFLNPSSSEELYINGLSFDETKEMISSLHAEMDNEMLTKLWLNFEGTPIAMKLFALFFKEKKDFFPLNLTIDDQILYFQREVLENLSEAEQYILRTLSIHRKPIRADALKKNGNKSKGANPNPNLNSLLHSLQKKMLVYRNKDNEYFILDCAKKIIYSTLSYPEEAHASAAEYYLSKETTENAIEAIHHFSKCHNNKKILQILEDEVLNQKYDFINKGYALSILSILDSLRLGHVDNGKGNVSLPYLHMLKRQAEEALKIQEKGKIEIR
ncbi:MAG: hypothetical protein M3162_00385 [Thermoproteota archaeon]|nr:hypothetical protein [Thermoproteota archaeon]